MVDRMSKIKSKGALQKVSGVQGLRQILQSYLGKSKADDEVAQVPVIQGSVDMGVSVVADKDKLVVETLTDQEGSFAEVREDLQCHPVSDSEHNHDGLDDRPDLEQAVQTTGSDWANEVESQVDEGTHATGSQHELDAAQAGETWVMVANRGVATLVANRSKKTQKSVDGAQGFVISVTHGATQHASHTGLFRGTACGHGHGHG